MEEDSLYEPFLHWHVPDGNPEGDSWQSVEPAQGKNAAWREPLDQEHVIETTGALELSKQSAGF